MALMINYNNSFFKSKTAFGRQAAKISADVIYQSDPRSNAHRAGEEMN